MSHFDLCMLTSVVLFRMMGTVASAQGSFFPLSLRIPSENVFFSIKYKCLLINIHYMHLLNIFIGVNNVVKITREEK